MRDGIGASLGWALPGTGADSADTTDGPADE